MSKFLKESEMTAVVSAWLADQGLRVKQQVRLPWGVPDLVAVSLNNDRVRKRLQLQQKQVVGSVSRMLILLAVPDIESKHSVSFEQLAADLRDVFSTTEELAAELKTLEARRFVRMDRSGSLQKLNGWMPLQDRLVAVELKLGRVDEALSQANKNRELTWESYVGLPSEVAQRVLRCEKSAEFRSMGVGLLEIAPDRVTSLLQPQRRCDCRNSALEMHFVERFWRPPL